MVKKLLPVCAETSPLLPTPPRQASLHPFHNQHKVFATTHQCFQYFFQPLG